MGDDTPWSDDAREGQDLVETDDLIPPYWTVDCPQCKQVLSTSRLPKYAHSNANWHNTITGHDPTVTEHG